MILASGLLAVSAVVLIAGPRLLGRSPLGERAPLASILAWQAASWCVVTGVALAAAMLAAPSLASASRLPADLEACLAALQRTLGSPADSALVQSIAAGILGLLLARLVGCAGRFALVNHRQRARHRALLTLVGRADPALGALVVPDPAAAVYCLPGRGGRIVFTSSAVERLTARQRRAVLAHEQAHLRGRHHLLIASGNLLGRAFPGIPLFRLAREHTIRLVEMRADDLASRGHGRRPVAEALLALSVMGSSATVLAASAVRTAERIERLLAEQPGRPARRPRHAFMLLFASAGLATSPVVLAAAGHAMLCMV